MFDEKTILARLQNGEDAQKIADEMAAAINKANKMYQDQKAAEEAAKVQKKEDLQRIVDEFCGWCADYLGMTTDEFGIITADQVIELIDSLKGYLVAIKDLENILAYKEQRNK